MTLKTPNLAIVYLTFSVMTGMTGAAFAQEPQTSPPSATAPPAAAPAPAQAADEGVRRPPCAPPDCVVVPNPVTGQLECRGPAYCGGR
jgi:hypothetical protein